MVDIYNNKQNEKGISFVLNVRDKLTPFVSRYFNTKQLTMLSLVWNIGIIGAGVLSIYNPNYLLAIPIFLILHNITDIFDGAVGRYNNEGYVKWGFFMDHLFDFTIVLSTFFALILYYYKNRTVAISLFLIMSCMLINMVTSFLSFVDLGFDVSLCITKYCINVFWSIYIMVAFIIYIWYVKHNINESFLMLSVVVFVIATIYNVYIKQRKLGKLDESKHLKS